MAAALVAGKPATRGADDVGYLLPDVSRRPVLDPSIPFAVHTAEGEVVDIHLGPEVRAGAGLRLADPDLDGYVVLDFDTFDGWWEEDEPKCRAPAGSVPPHRCPAKLAPGPARARRRGAGGVGPASAAVRDDASDPLLPAPRGRQGGADPERDSNDLRLQGRATRRTSRLWSTVGRWRTSPGPTSNRCRRPRWSRGWSPSSTNESTWCWTAYGGSGQSRRGRGTPLAEITSRSRAGSRGAAGASRGRSPPCPPVTAVRRAPE